MIEELVNDLISKKVSPYGIALSLILYLKEKGFKNEQMCDSYLKSWKSEILHSRDELLEKEIIMDHQDNLSFNNLQLVRRYKPVVMDESFDMAEELWNAYPVVLPITTGGQFLARKGPDKQAVLELYLKKINNSTEKHKFVMKQLETYVKLVFANKINGDKIVTWISNETWNDIPELEQSKGEFKTDI